MKNKLYLLTNMGTKGYDTYDSAVVVAKNKDDARQMKPRWAVAGKCWGYPEDIVVEKIGKTNLPLGDIVIASFNAG